MIRYALLFFGLFMMSFWAHAQCGQGTQSVTIRGAHHTLKLRNDGSLISSADGPGWLLRGEDGVERPLYRQLNLWMFGLDSLDQIRGNASNHPFNNVSLNTGPLSEDGTQLDSPNCEWDHIWVVKEFEIESFIADYEDDLQVDATQHPTIFSWPAKGNSFFTQFFNMELPNTSEGLAPFHDLNGNNIFEPNFGEYPAIQCAKEAAWWVVNSLDQTLTQMEMDLAVEIQILAMTGIEPTDSEILERTSYLEIKMINRTPHEIDSFAIGFQAYPLLGHRSDDYTGYNSAVNSMFVYNKDSLDGPQSMPDTDSLAFLADKPLAGIAQLNPFHIPAIYENNTWESPPLGVPADTLIAVNPTKAMSCYYGIATGNPGIYCPDQLWEFVNYLNGTWRDGTLPTTGGSGYNLSSPGTIDYIHPGNPANPTEWSRCTAPLVASDWSTIMSTHDIRLDPNAVLHTTLALHHILPPEATCPDINPFQEAIQEIQNWKEERCSRFPTSASEIYKSSNITITSYPNPAQDKIIFEDLTQSGIRLGNIHVFDLLGRVVTIKDFSGDSTGILHRGNIASGLYFYQLEILGSSFLQEGKIIFH